MHLFCIAISASAYAWLKLARHDIFLLSHRVCDIALYLEQACWAWRTSFAVHWVLRIGGTAGIS